MFADREQFVIVHHPCGDVTGDVGELTKTGYSLYLACCCGAAFERWVSPDAADQDLLRSLISAFPS
jgi:hypothetical protein